MWSLCCSGVARNQSLLCHYPRASCIMQDGGLHVGPLRSCSSWPGLDTLLGGLADYSSDDVAFFSACTSHMMIRLTASPRSPPRGRTTQTPWIAHYRVTTAARGAGAGGASRRGRRRRPGRSRRPPPRCCSSPPCLRRRGRTPSSPSCRAPRGRWRASSGLAGRRQHVRSPLRACTRRGGLA